MKHLLYGVNPDNKYKIAVLIKEAAFKADLMAKHYFLPLHATGIPTEDIIGLSLKYNEHGKAPAKLIKSHLEVILKACEKLETTTLLVADSDYYKKLVGVSKATPHYGYIKPCAFKGYEHINVILSVNYQGLFYNPVMQEKLDMSISTLANHTNGTHIDLGQGIIHSSEYPSTYAEIEDWLTVLYNYSELTVDIETFSLIFNKAGIGTIAFAWDEHNGIAFPVDYVKTHTDEQLSEGIFGSQGNNHGIKALLKQFFLTYRGKLTYHSGTFDIKVLIYELFMDNLLDNEGLVEGLDCMYQSINDTKIITYLATNTTAGNHLGLKHNAFEFAGNYAQDDITDIRKIVLSDLLKYNLIDSLATWYVKKKNWPIMIQDQQLDIYNDIMIPSMKVITHMELTGMPMSKEGIKTLHSELLAVVLKQKKIILDSQLVKDFEWEQQRLRYVTANLLLKKKVRPIEDFEERFNPASDKQTQRLLYEAFGLPIIDTTDTGAPATGAKTIKKLLNQLKLEFNITDKELEQ